MSETKAQETKAEEKKDAVVKIETGSLAQVDFGDHAGAGFDNQTSNDMAIPFLGLLQDLSPQVKKKNDEYIEGAEAGMLFNTVTQELMGDTCYIVACHTDNVFVEWVPRDKGGGFVAVHALNSEVVARARSQSASFNELKTDDGNDLIETFYIYALLLDGPNATSSSMPIVLAFTSTKIKVYKRLMTKLRTIKGKPPLFAFRLAVGVKDETNSANQPYSNWTIDFANSGMEDSINLPGNKHADLLEEGVQFLKAVREGNAKAAHESQRTEGGGGSTDDGDTPF